MCGQQSVQSVQSLQTRAILAAASAIADVELEPAEARATYDCLKADMKAGLCRFQRARGGALSRLESLCDGALCLGHPWRAACDELRQ